MGEAGEQDIACKYRTGPGRAIGRLSSAGNEEALEMNAVQLD